MILSRAELPWPIARNPYEHHRRLWRLFPDRPAESRQRQEQSRQGFLFRVEDNPLGQSARILLQSSTRPTPSEGIKLLASRELDPQPTVGQRLAFILTANPIKTIKDTQRSDKPEKRRDTCRVPLITEASQAAWLARKLEGAATMDSVSILPHPPVFFRRGNRAGKLVMVTFEGMLTVTDPEKLQALLSNGVGPAKAFGCGLLLVRRLA
jgi:CRISPR system Cascade subunit CasE